MFNSIDHGYPIMKACDVATVKSPLHISQIDSATESQQSRLTRAGGAIIMDKFIKPANISSNQIQHSSITQNRVFNFKLSGH